MQSRPARACVTLGCGCVRPDRVLVSSGFAQRMAPGPRGRRTANGGPRMSKVCTVCGKHPIAGRNVSHSHRVTNRMFRPNIQKVNAVVDGRSSRGQRLHQVHEGRQDHARLAPARRRVTRRPLGDPVRLRPEHLDEGSTTSGSNWVPALSRSSSAPPSRACSASSVGHGQTSSRRYASTTAQDARAERDALTGEALDVARAVVVLVVVVDDRNDLAERRAWRRMSAATVGCIVTSPRSTVESGAVRAITESPAVSIPMSCSIDAIRAPVSRPHPGPSQHRWQQ